MGCFRLQFSLGWGMLGLALMVGFVVLLMFAFGVSVWEVCFGAVLVGFGSGGFTSILVLLVVGELVLLVWWIH